MADPYLTVNLHNQTKHPATLNAARGESCWYTQDLAFAPVPAPSPFRAKAAQLLSFRQTFLRKG